jgi:hypothetical protein
MRAILSNLPHPSLTERRHSRRRRGKRDSTQAHQAPQTHQAPQACEPTPVAHKLSDPAAQRVREAGGPIDRASYTCTCGYVFLASVSTTVECPHCHAAQAW